MNTATMYSMHAVTQSSIAHTHAALAKKIACQSMLHDYNAQAATIEEMHVYAGCVGLIYPPQPISGVAVIWLKLAFLAAIASMCFFGWREWRQSGSGIDTAIFALFGALGGGFAVLALWALLDGIVWLFS